MIIEWIRKGVENKTRFLSKTVLNSNHAPAGMNGWLFSAFRDKYATAIVKGKAIPVTGREGP
jgi:hypothetical protein